MERLPSEVEAKAICAGVGELFFNKIDYIGNPKKEQGRWQRIKRAKAVCDECPVKSPCLSWALRNKPDGIWGGTTKSERKLMLRDDE